MGKSVADAVLDAALSYISSNVTQMSACSTQPTTYGQATTTGSYMLAIKTGLTSGNFTGPADDTSGRKITVNAQSSVSVVSTGDAAHVALCSGAALLYVTTCTTQTLTNGNTVNFPAWDINIEDPT